MARFNGSVFSETLDMQTGLSVILPQHSEHKDAQGRLPVLFLLHGYGDDCRSWTANTAITRYAEKAGLAVVMPEVQHSYYTDMAYGLPYFRYLTEELPRLAREMFPLSCDPKYTYIAGLSMGGYGAMKAALHYPDRYAAVGCFSGAVDVRSIMGRPDARKNEWFAIGGETLSSENDLYHLTAQAAKRHVPLPAVYMTIGLSDFLYADTARFRQQMDFLKIPYVYEEWAGAHDWDVWDRSIRQFIRFIGY